MRSQSGNRSSRRALQAALAGFLALALAGGAASADDEPDPSLLDMQGLELLRALEEQEAADGAPPDEAEAPSPVAESEDAEAERGANEAKLEALLEEERELQSSLSDRVRDEGDSSETGAVSLDPRRAPRVPEERQLPTAIFDREEETVEAGRWGNRRRLKLVRLSLDADGDGVAELTRWIDPKTDKQIRREEDRNYDGVIDAWSDYEWGVLVARVLDGNDDGNPDSWERYEKERMVSREVDRDDDGVRDAFYRYDGDWLAEEKHDSDNDGRIDLVIRYRDGLRVSAEADSKLDGQPDTWTTYVVVGGREVVARIERDARGEGSVTVVELFDTGTGEAVIARKDEDVNGDGEIDVVSVYESGKLVRREISDPELLAEL